MARPVTPAATGGSAATAEARGGAEPESLVGVVVNGKFRVTGVVASGGMGKIYRAEQIPLGRPVAIKVLHPKYTRSEQDPAFQKRFFLEASILSRLQHPNIVTVFDYGRIENLSDEAYFMAMEFLPGETLHRRLKSHGPLPAQAAIALVRQVARGLREAHRNGVVHRDLKPSNIMLVPEDDGAENLKILDFGLVKVLSDDSEELTKEGSFLGSPRYMSPEQIAHGRVDHRTDIYSLGVIFYQCLTGRTPFEAENSVHILMAHLHQPVPAMREKTDLAVPEVLERFVLRCLDKQPEGRPSGMDEFLRGLRECEVSLGLATGPAPTTGAFAGPQMASAMAQMLRESQPSHPHDPSGSGHRTGSGQLLGPSISQVSHVGSIPLAMMPVQPSPAPAASKAPYILVGVAMVVLGVVAAAALSGQRRGDSAAQSASAEGAPREYQLVIDANVQGAQVFENEALLGQTPLSVLVDNVAARTRGRRLEVRLAGYEPFPLMVGPSGERSVRVVATLTPRVAAPATPTPATPTPETPVSQALTPEPTRPSPRPRPRPQASPQTHPVVAPPPPDDIRSHR